MKNLYENKTAVTSLANSHKKLAAFIKLIAILVIFIGMPGVGWGQTNPTPQALPYSQNFGTTTFTAMPSGMAAWSGISGAGVTTQALAEASVPNANATLTATSTIQTAGGTYGFATSSNGRPYIQTSSNTSSGANQLALAIITTGKTNIVVAYDVEIISAQPRTVGIVMQYRIGTSGTWTTVTGTGNPFSQAGGTTGVKANASVTLPAAAENQSVVQIRWATWRGTEGGNSSGIAIDNLSVTGTAASCTDPTTQATNVAFSNILSDQMTVGWTRGGTPGDGVIVVAKAGSAPDDPTDGTSYTANAAFGSGTQIGSGTYVVFIGAGTSVNVTALSASTTYYYKVFEKNCTGTSIMINTASPAEGNQTTTAACAINPTITTTVASNTIAVTTASSGGQGLSSGENCSITQKGVCWNTSTGPTTANSKTTDGTGTLDFTSSLTSLSAQTLYYVRAYATNSFGTGYGPEITFRTLSLEPAAHPGTFTATAASSSQINLTFSAASTITNADGYIILRRTGSNPTGTNITDGVAPTSLTMPSGTTFVTDINSTSTTTYNNTGLPNANTQYNYAIIAYNWDGINPETYNYYTSGTIKTANATTLPPTMTVPYTQDFEGTTTEWVLETTGTNKWAIGSATSNGGTKAMYISNNSGTSNLYTVTSTTNTQASVRVDLTGLTSASLVFDWKANGEVLSGTYYDYGEVYLNNGVSDILISNANEFQSTTAFATKNISLTPYVGGIVTIEFKWINDGSSGSQPPFAVDNVSVVSGSFPIVTTSAITSIMVNSASGGGNVTNDGGSTVTARGVCWNTTGAPTISDPKTTNGSGTGSFTSSISGLTDNTLYYVRAYATNSTGTAYGDVVSFTTSSVSAPVATAATGVSSISFNSNWGAVTGASGGYLLDVSASATFGTISPASLSEGFETGLSSSGYVSTSLNLSSGIWNFVESGLRNDDENSGTYSCQLKATTGTATTPALNNVGTLTFYAKSPNGSTTMTIKKIVNSITTTVTTKTITTLWGQYTVPINDNSSAVQIVFANGSNFTLIDDISISYTGIVPSFVAGYEAKPISGQSTETTNVTGLTPSTPYYYRVRAVGANSTSINSNVIGVSTTSGLKSTISDGDWNVAGIWSDNQVPTANDDVTILHMVTLPTQFGFNTASCKNLAVNEPNGSLTIKAGASLITTGSVQGSVTVESNITSGFWHLISSPVSDATSNVFNGKYLQEHNEQTNLYSDITATNISLNAGKGFATYNSSGFTAYYTGQLNTGTINYSTTRNGDGWNLVGNPYPSNIDFTKLIRTNINGAFYLHISNSSWGVYNAGLGTGDIPVTEFIAPGQGFFVEATGTGSIEFNDESRTHTFGAFQKKTAIVSNMVRLEVSGNGYKDDAAVRIAEGSTNMFDGEWDGHKIFGDVADAAQIYTLGDTPLAINAIPEATSVVIGIHSGTSGTYTIAATEINDLQNVKLEDTKTGIITDLTTKSYTFEFTAGENESRFKLHFTALGMDEKETTSANIYSYQQTVYVNLADNTQGDIYIYNLAGQLVTAKESASGNVRIGLTSTGVYMVKVVTQKETLTQKVVIR